jgi:hypothetical protein
MIGPPPVTNDVKQLRDWCDQLYQWLIYPDKLEIQFIEMKELANDPSAPGTNRVRLYAKDTGGSKTRIYARFSTGVVQTVATEP